jgi:hypothetical protein
LGEGYSSGSAASAAADFQERAGQIFWRRRQDEEFAMIYYRSDRGSRDLSVEAVRIATATSLTAYPAGALLLALGPDGLGTTLAGYGLILLSLVAYAPLIGSSVQRIVGEDAKLLDEYELRLRGRALGASYAAFTVFTLLLVLYAAIATDKGVWFPTTFEQFNGVFWGIFLCASVLPTAILSWVVDPSFTRDA